MNDNYVEAFNIQTFNQNGTENAILIIKHYNPLNLIFQHLPGKEKVKSIEVNRMRNGYILMFLTNVDIQEIVKKGGRLIQIYEGVIYQENFKITPFRKVIEKLFALRQKHKDEGNDLMQGSVKVILNSLYGMVIRKDLNERYKCKSEHWMQTEYDHNVLDSWKLPNGNLIVNSKEADGFDCAIDVNIHCPLI